MPARQNIIETHNCILLFVIVYFVRQQKNERDTYTVALGGKKEMCKKLVNFASKDIGFGFTQGHRSLTMVDQWWWSCQ